MSEGPWPNELDRKKLCESASLEAVGEEESIAIELFYSRTTNDALGHAWGEGMNSEDTINHVLGKLREEHSEQFPNWESIEEHIRGWVEGAA